MIRATSKPTQNDYFLGQSLAIQPVQSLFKIGALLVIHLMNGDLTLLSGNLLEGKKRVRITNQDLWKYACPNETIPATVDGYGTIRFLHPPSKEFGRWRWPRGGLHSR